MKLRYKLLVLALAVFGLGAGYIFFDSKPAEAYSVNDLIINEFFLGSSDAQWIEVLNITDNVIDLTDWEFVVAPMDGDNSYSGAPNTTTLSGLVPAKGLLVISGAGLMYAEGAPTGLFMQIVVSNTPISAVSYGYHVTGVPYVAKPDATSSTPESAMQDMGSWSVTTSISRGWYNITTSTLDCDSPPVPGPGVTPPSLSAIATCLPPGVESNITDSSFDPTNAQGLYFFKEGMGEIVLNQSTFNITDQNSMNLLQNLKTKLELDGGRVALDASTAALMRDAGAEIYFYGLSDLGYHNIDINSVIVRGDDGNIIPTSSEDYPDITGVNWYDSNTGTLQFTTEHFSGYETVPVLAEINPVPTPINTTTSSYTFSANVTGTFMFLGDCSSTPMGSTTNGNNTVVVGPLSAGYHSDCAVKVIDGAGASSTLAMSAFTVDLTQPQVATTTPNPSCVGAGAVGSSTFSFTVYYDEPMNQTVTPTVAFNPPLSMPLPEASRLYGWVNSTTFRVTSDVNMMDGMTWTNVTSSVSSTPDLAGNYSSDLVVPYSFLVDYVTSSPPVIDSVDGSSSTPQTSNNANPVVIVGGLTAGDTLKIFDGAVEIDSVAATATTMIRTLSLSDGSHSLSAKAVDPCGNVSDASNVIVYTLDATPPSAPTINAVNGTSTSPLYGNTSTLGITFSGLDVGSTVYVYASSSLIHTFTPSGTSETVTSTNPLSDEGAWDIFAFAVDPLNNTSTNSNVYVYNYDTTAPSVSSVSTSKLDGYYKTDEIVGFNVNFDETVVINGSPWLYVDVGVGRHATWVAGYFSYHVLAGDASSDLDYTSTTALTLNGGTIKDLAGNDADLTLPATGTFSGAHDIVIDTATPTVAFADDVEAGPATSDTINITVSDANPDTSSYAYAYSSDAVCDGSDSYSTAFTSGADFTISYNTNNGKYICAKAIDLAGNITYLASANPLNVSTAPPSSGGGGGDRTAPTNISMQINNGAALTTSTFVSLSIGALDATYMRISNLSDLSGAEWQPFTTSEGWTLEPGVGTKKVWIQFRDNAFNLTNAIYDTIELVEPGQEGVIPISAPLPAGTVGPTCPTIKAGDMVKVIGKPAIYAVNKMMEAMYFPSGDEFKSWRPTYGGYLAVDQECFDSIKVPKSYPAAVNYRPGSYVIKRPSSDQLYVILPGNTLAKIPAHIAEALYGTSAYTDGVGSKVMVVDDVFWPHYVNRAADIDIVKVHEGMLIKSNGKTYYIDADDTMREVTSAGFIANGFQERYVRVVPASALDGMVTGDVISSEIPELTDKTQGAGGA